MKFIFLDIDGVLNRLDSPSMFSLGKSKLRRFHQLVKETGAEIILSSSWRMSTLHRELLKRSLAYRGLKITAETPVFSGMDHNRGQEIQSILDELQPKSYVILDDVFGTQEKEEFLESQYKHLVLTDGWIGLTDEDCAKAKEILSKKAT